MKNSKPNFVFVVAWSLLLLAFPTFVISQRQSPLTKQQIMVALENIKNAKSEKEKDETKKATITYIKKIGVRFNLTEQEKKELIALGLDDEINLAISENFILVFPLSKESVTRTIVNLKQTKNVGGEKEFIENIRYQKVNFEITKEVETELRELGAKTQIIRTLRDNYLPQTDLPPPNLSPFTLVGVLEQLGKDNSPEGQKKLISQIETRKYEGQLSKDDEAFLVQDKGSPELIETIKNNPFVAEVVVNTGKSFKNPKTGMEFLLVPKGSFMMGTVVGSTFFVENETPARKVTFAKDFFIGKYEVTQGEWEALMGSPKEKVEAVKGDNKDLSEILEANYPMVGVSWFDAEQFIAKLNELNDGYEYSLPSEAEWEYACRAGTDTQWSFGDTLNEKLANFDNQQRLNRAPKYNTPEKEIYKLKTIGLYEPNQWGLYDMHGNVWEWVKDAYLNTYKGLKLDGTANTTLGDTSSRIRRGGGFSSQTNSFLRSRNRDYKNPNYKDLATGFRVVARLKEIPKPK